MDPDHCTSPSLQLEWPHGKEAPDRLGALQGWTRGERRTRVGGTLEASDLPFSTTGCLGAPTTSLLHPAPPSPLGAAAWAPEQQLSLQPEMSHRLLGEEAEESPNF